MKREIDYSYTSTTINIEKIVFKENPKKDDNCMEGERIEVFSLHVNEDYTFTERVHLFFQTRKEGPYPLRSSPNMVITIRIYRTIHTTNDDLMFKLKKALERFQIINLDEFVDAFVFRKFYTKAIKHDIP